MITGRTAVDLWIVYFTDERVDDLDSRIYSRDIGHRGRFSLIIVWASVKQTNSRRNGLCRKIAL